MTKRLTPAQVAARLSIHVKRVYEMIDSGKLRAINVSTGQKQPRWRVNEDDLHAFESQRST